MNSAAGLAIPDSDAPNYAPAEPLKRYLDANGEPQKPFEQWIKTTTTALEQLNDLEWRELALVWELVNKFIEGKQMLRRRHRGFGWSAIPLPESTAANIREQNKLSFYSHTLMSKWVASRTRINAIPGDDSDEAQGAARSADLFYAALEPMIYHEKFRQQEALAGQTHGTYARYFYYDQSADGGYAEEPVTEPEAFKLGEDTGECFDCGYAGGAGEFIGADNGSIGVSGFPADQSPLTAVNPQFGQGGVGGQYEQPNQASFDNTALRSGQVGDGSNGATGISGNGSAYSSGADDGFGGVPGRDDQIAATCPHCGSPNVQITEAPEEQIEKVVGSRKYKLGNLNGISVPYSQLRHEIGSSLEDSEWVRWRRRVRIEVIKAQFQGLKVPPINSTKDRDPGLEYEASMRRSVATASNSTTRDGSKDHKPYTDFTQWWLKPCMYQEYVFPSDVETLAGEVIPAGSKAKDLFPDGMYIAMCEGIDAPLQIRNEKQTDHWVTAPYHLRLFTGLGIGINDAVEMQRQWNLILSLIFTQIRTAAVPGWLYDKDAIAPDEVRKLGMPQNNVPVSLRNRDEKTRLEQLVHRMEPGQIPSHLFAYVSLLDANMQTISGALVNEGVPGTDSKTATGAQLMTAAAAQHNAPEFALKGDADVRSAYVLLELAKTHYVEPRYLPLNGKRGKQDGVWLSGMDLANGQVRLEAVRDTWMPSTRLDKQEAIGKLLLTFGGVQGLMMAQQAMPDFVNEVAEAFGVDISGDIFEPTALLCRQRVDQLQKMAPQYEQIAQQLQMMQAMMPPMAMQPAPPQDGMPPDGSGEVDPATGQPMQAQPLDPMAMIGDEMVASLTPPVELEEPGHQFSIKWLRDFFLDDQCKEGSPTFRAGVKALVKKHYELLIIEGQLLGAAQMMIDPMMGQGGEEQNGAPGQPQKTGSDQRKDSARANMGDGKGDTKQPRPSPMPAGGM